METFGDSTAGDFLPSISLCEDFRGKVMDRIGEGFCLDFDGRYCDLKMKEHHEQLLHTQLHVTDMLSRLGLEGVQKHLLCMFAQSGALLLFAGSGERSVGSVSGTEFLNDMEGLAPIESLMSIPKDESLGQWGLGKGGHTWTFSRIRHQMALFLMLFRMVELVRLAKLPRKDLPLHEIHEFHREAGMDKFYELSMRYDLPPGAVLVYMHMFSGMYNSVSQVVFYNYPNYQRRVQLDLEKLNEGIHGAFTMAPLLEMEPDVEVVCEEALVVPAPGDSYAEKGKWRVILICGTVFMLSPNGKVFCDKNVKRLFALVQHEREMQR